MVNKLRNLIKRAVVTNPGKDDKEIPVTQIGYFGKTADTEILYPYGIGGVPPKGSICLVFAVGADESNRSAIASLPQSRIKNLKEGDVFFSNQLTGDSIIIRNDRIEIQSSKEVNITAPIVNIIGDTALGGLGGLPIARIGDAISSPSGPGVITGGSTNHTAT